MPAPTPKMESEKEKKEEKKDEKKQDEKEVEMVSCVKFNSASKKVSSCDENWILYFWRSNE